MGVYEENLKTLKERYPHLWLRMTQMEREKSKIRVVKSRIEGQPTVIVEDDRGSFYLHSAYDPSEEAKRMIDNIPLEDISSLWVMGVGMGFTVSELLNRRNMNFITVIVESDPNLFDVFLHTNVATEALKWQYFVFVTGNAEWLEKDMEAVLQSKVNFQMGQAHFLLTPGFERYAGPTYRELANKVVSFTKYRYINLGNSIEDTLDGLTNSFKNINVLSQSPGVRQIQGKYSDTPAILVSAGPSLEKNVDLLGEAKGKAVIISSDTTLPLLLRKGIEPDIVTTVERIPEVYEWFYRDFDLPPDLWLVALNVADTRLFNTFPDRHLLAIRATEPLSNWFDSITDKKAGVTTGPSTSHLALSVAHLMGCRPIILIGQDLALGKDDQYYARGGVTNQKGYDTSGDVWVKDYENNDIKSTRMLKQYLDWFEYYIRDTGVECIDATEGGAYIQGTRVMTLRESLDRYCISRPDFSPIEEVINEASVTPISRIIEETGGFKRDFESIYELVEKMMDSLDDLLKKPENEIKEASITTQKMFNDVLLNISFRGRVQFFLQSITTNAMTRLSSRGRLKNESEMRDFMKYVRKFFEDIMQATEICIYTLNKIIVDVENTTCLVSQTN